MWDGILSHGLLDLVIGFRLWHGERIFIDVWELVSEVAGIISGSRRVFKSFFLVRGGGGKICKAICVSE